MAARACEVWFYHLERTSLDRALPELLEKTLAKGWRAVVRARDRDRVEQLDGWLWSYRDETFLPHGLAEEAHAARQPVLLTNGFETPNGAQALFLIDDAEPGSLDGFERCIFLFDGQDAAAVGAARARWKTLKAQGASISYWKQNERGGWEKAA
jgi:DNA polymerase-3 subunit chi